MNWRSPHALFTSFMTVCVCGQLYGLRRLRQGRPPRTRGSLQAFGAGLGCLWLRGIPSAEFLHAGPSAAQPALESLQSRLPMLRFGVFLRAFGGAAGLIVLSVYVSHVHTTRTLGICFEWVYTTDPPPALSGSKTGEHVARAA